MQRRWMLLAALGVAGTGLGFLTGFATATAPHPEARGHVAAGPGPTATAAPKPTQAESPPAPEAQVPPTAPAPSTVPAPPTAAPAPPTAPPSSPAANTPDAAVADFYRLVAQHQFDAAVRLWSPRMQANYPPAENVYQRFADTTSLTLVRDQVSQAGDASSVVSVDLVEVRAGQTYRWTGSWYLVRSSATWLLDQPALRPG